MIPIDQGAKYRSNNGILNITYTEEQLTEPSVTTKKPAIFEKIKNFIFGKEVEGMYDTLQVAVISQMRRVVTRVKF